MTVAHLDDALAGGGCFRVVSDHDDRLIEAVVKVSKHFQDQR